MSYTLLSPFPAGMPSWVKDGKPWGLIALHDTEGGTGLAGATGTINFLLSTAQQRNASYHEIWSWQSGLLTVQRIVPPTRAAGSINPVPYGQTGGAYDPDTWVRDSLGPNYWDPNQCSYAVSIAGRVADVDTYSTNPAFVAAAKSRLLDISAELHVVRLAEHFRYQPHDRSDWGLKLTPALGGLTLKRPLYGLPGWPDYARSTLAGAEGYAYRIFFNAGKVKMTGTAGTFGMASWPLYARFSLATAEAYALRVFMNNPSYRP